ANIPLIAAFLIVAYGAGLLSGYLFNNRHQEIAQILEAAPAKSAQNERPLFFSHITRGGRTRTFDFPAQSIGTIVDRKGVSYDARGRKVFREFQPLSFLPNIYLGEHPQLLLRFRPDEIFSLNTNEICRSINFATTKLAPVEFDEVMVNSRHLTGINDLILQ